MLQVTLDTIDLTDHDARVSRCETCWPETGCYRPEHYHTYYVDQYGQVEGSSPKEQELNMMTEIYNHGPISCAISVTDELVSYTGGIFTGPLNATQVNHDISVVGYGEENGEKYWIIRNSWGTYWGENGYFRLARGNMHRYPNNIKQYHDHDQESTILPLRVVCVVGQHPRIPGLM